MSRRFVPATETALADLLAADLSGLDLVGVMIDGVHFGDHLRGGARDRDRWHPASPGAGRGQHREHQRGHRPVDRAAGPWSGHDSADHRRHRQWQSAARRGGAAVRASGDRSLPTPQDRNVADKLPDHLAATVRKRMRAAYHAESAVVAEAPLEAIANEPGHPGTAGSLREGLAETLTVPRLGVSPTLARTLRSTGSG